MRSHENPRLGCAVDVTEGALGDFRIREKKYGGQCVWSMQRKSFRFEPRGCCGFLHLIGSATSVGERRASKTWMETPLRKKLDLC